ncbi:MAG: nucleotidyltransferase domain-containing protein [Planctomycetota bacterium]
MTNRELLENLAQHHEVLVIYLFGSRARDGERALGGCEVERNGSDLDVGVLLKHAPSDLFLAYGGLQADLEELFRPLRVDLVLLHEADAFLQEAAIKGIEIFCADPHRRDLYELEIMRRVGDLLPIQRQLERVLYGTSSR